MLHHTVEVQQLMTLKAMLQDCQGHNIICSAVHTNNVRDIRMSYMYDPEHDLPDAVMFAVNKTSVMLL